MEEYRFVAAIMYERVLKGKKRQWGEPKSLWRYLLVKVTGPSLEESDVKIKATDYIINHTKIEYWQCPMGYNGNYRFVLYKVDEFPPGVKIVQFEISKEIKDRAKAKKKVPSKKKRTPKKPKKNQRRRHREKTNRYRPPK